MSRKGNPWDNAACESFMKTLKYEEVFRNEYRDLVEAKRSIALSQGFPLCDMLMSMPWSFSKSV
jgi:transposase InsO family protein